MKFSECLLYADDAKLFKEISSIDNYSKLQEDLCTFNAWCDRNYLFLNIDKRYVVNSSRKTAKSVFYYHINGTSLCFNDRALDMDIILDDELSFTEYIKYVLNKCNKDLVLIRLCSLTNTYTIHFYEY